MGGGGGGGGYKFMVRRHFSLLPFSLLPAKWHFEHIYCGLQCLRRRKGEEKKKRSAGVLTWLVFISYLVLNILFPIYL